MKEDKVMKVLIADDEYFIRQRIKKIIPWEDLNLTFAGEAENGQQVLDYLKEDHFDILILDIKMPHHSGLEIADYVYKNHLKTAIIILSGYSDFEYAREALRSEVYDYLVKPIKEEDLTASLKSCIEKIQRIAKEQLERDRLQEFNRRNDLYHILSNNLKLPALFQKYADLSAYPYTLFIGLFVTDQTDMVAREVHDLCQKDGVLCEIYQEDENSCTIQIFYKSKEDPNFLKETLQRYMNTYHGDIFLVLGDGADTSKSYIQNYKLVRRCLHQRYFSDNKNLFLTSEYVRKELNTTALANIRNNMLFFLNSKNKDEFQSYIDLLFQEIAKKKSSDYLYLIVTEMFITYHIQYEKEMNREENITEQVKAFIGEEYKLESLKDGIISYGLRLSSHADVLPSDAKLAQKIVQYLKDHYTDPDLSIANISKLFNLTSSYMGSIFKKVTNQSMIQYLTTLRMEKAKELLMENQYKISDIATMVGYSDVFYYSKRFKKMYGYSPKDYYLKEQMKKQ